MGHPAAYEATLDETLSAMLAASRAPHSFWRWHLQGMDQYNERKVFLELVNAATGVMKLPSHISPLVTPPMSVCQCNTLVMCIMLCMFMFPLKQMNCECG